MKTRIAMVVLSILLLAATQGVAQVNTYTIHWSNKLATTGVSWDNTAAYCNVSVDWVNPAGQTLQTFTDPTALKASPWSEAQRDQTISRLVTPLGTDKCHTLRLHATCHTKASPSSEYHTVTYHRDARPCASAPADIRAYDLGILWNPAPYTDPGN